jgi:hypothetical protein
MARFDADSDPVDLAAVGLACIRRGGELGLRIRLGNVGSCK